MELRHIVNAAPAMQVLIGQRLPLRCAFELMELADEMNKYLRYYQLRLEEEATEEDMERLLSFDVSLCRKVDIPAGTPVLLSPAEVKQLLPFINIEEVNI